ncbi:MAG: DUF4847 domain-containing protein [Bacteroides sp.]|nr:DUF4847 domain-containing protein [Bacteroides sp.]
MKQTIRNIGYLLLAIAILPFLGGCNDEDDVIKIFTGKTWKLSYIGLEGSYQQYNFWGEKGMSPNNPAYTNSMDLLKQANNFTITFNGSTLVNNTPGGTFEGKIVDPAGFDGTWKADGKNHTLSLNPDGVWPGESDVLAKAFREGLMNAFQYGGDSRNLFIYYKDGQTTKFMGFTPKQ